MCWDDGTDTERSERAGRLHNLPKLPTYLRLTLQTTYAGYLRMIWPFGAVMRVPGGTVC